MYILCARALNGCVRVRTYRRGLRVVGSIILGNARASKGGTTTVGLHAFLYAYIRTLTNNLILTKKNKIMKKLCTIFILSLCAITTMAYDFYCNGIYYNYLDIKSVEVTYYAYDIYSGQITIPSTVQYDSYTYNVVRIGDESFKDCSGLIAINLPNSIMEIGESSFEGCSRLASITLPSSITKIEYSAFRGCSRLASITLPSSITRIENGTFCGCKSLTSVTIPSDVTYIGSGAFEDCSALKSIKIPNAVTNIDWRVFIGCSSLTSITLPNSVTTIGDYAFGDCSALTSITIPNSVTNIGEAAFSGCKSLISISIPNGVTRIKSFTFSGCSALTSIIIPHTVTELESYAFNYCSSLTSITIPNSVTRIGTGAFTKCESLTSVTIPSHTEIGVDAFPFHLKNSQKEEEEDVIFINVESMPEFHGGPQAMMKYIADNLNYPVIAQENGIQGRVICQFVVEKDGSLSDICVVRSSGEASLDKEAVRIFASMPKWIPGKQQGTPVRVKYTAPVNFRLE